MLRSHFRQIGLFACAIGVIGLSAYASQHVWRENGLKSLQAVNEPRLQLIANAINAEIGRQDHLPVVLSLDADVQAALEALGDPGRSAPLLERLNRKLARLSLEANTRAMFVIGPDGTVIASDDWDAPDTLVGRNLADRPYFAQAVANNDSSYLGIEPSTNRVRYYLAQAIRDSALRGVAVVRIEFDALEAAWEKAGERVLVTDSDGVVFLSSDPAYRYRGFGRFESPMRLVRSVTDRYLGAPVDDIDGQILERRGADLIVRIDSPEHGTYLSQTIMLPEYGWTIHRLTELTTVNEDQRDGAIIGGSLSALIIILALYVLQRHRAFLAASKSGAELQRQVAERTHELSESNASLHTEIEERRRTEARLRATQNELVQAGKLAALGQMSAAIAHEINQPLAAIRTFMASTKIFVQRGELGQVVRNLDLITDLAERMASITGHLKTFARKSEPGHPEPVAGRARGRAHAGPARKPDQKRGRARREGHRARPPGQRSRGPARAGDPQSRRQCARRRRRPGRALDQDQGPRDCGHRRHRRCRQRPRHLGGRDRSDLRSVLHHQAAGQGSRPWALHFLRHRPGLRRPDPRRQSAGGRGRAHRRTAAPPA